MKINSPLAGNVTIYALIDPRTNEVRYVGKTADRLARRVANHISTARRPGNKRHVGCWLRNLDREGLAPVVRILEIVSPDTWVEAERYWIALYRQTGDLTNHTDGGEGKVGYSGWNHTDEAKAKIRATKALRPQSQEARTRVGLGNRGSLNGRAKLTEEAVKEIKTLILTQQYSQRELASQFGVSRELIGSIQRNQKWAHVPWPSQESRSTSKETQ